MSVGRRSLAFVASTVLLAVVWWSWRHDTPDAKTVLVNFDAFAYYLPTFTFAYRELAAGRFPLWNPYQHCGSPFFATAQHVLLYPLNLPFLLLDTPDAMRVMAVLHVVLAGVTMRALARTLGIGAGGATIAGTAFAFSPRVAGLATLPHHLYAVAWMPLVALLAIRMADRPRRLRWPILAGVVVAVQYLGGYPQLCLYSWYLAGALFVWRLGRAWRSGTGAPSLAHLGGLAVAGVLGFGLSAPQLLPALELASQSVRDVAGLSIETADALWGRVQPWRTVLFGFLALEGEGTSLGVPAIGMTGFVLAVLAVANRRRRDVAGVFLLVLFVSAALSLGRHTPLFGWYFHLPTARLFRDPERFVAVSAVALAVLVGIGVDAVRAPGTRRRAALGCLLVGGLLWGASWWEPAVRSLDALVAIDPTREAGMAVRGRQLAWHFVGIGAGLVLLGPARGARWVEALLALQLALFLGLAGVYRNAFVLAETRGVDYRLPAPVVDYVREHQGIERSVVTYFPVMALERASPAKAGMLYGLYVLGDRENVYPRRLAEFLGRLAPADFDERQSAAMALLGASGEVLPQGEVVIARGSPRRLLDLAGVRFFVDAGGDLDDGGSEQPLATVFEEAGVRVLRSPTTLPRVFVAHRAEVVASDAVLDRLLDPAVDLRTTVVLEEAPAHALVPALRPWQAFQAATVTRYEPGEVVVDATTLVPGMLVLTDQFYPGWESDIDGVAAPIQRADGIFRAVPLPPGRHRVTFRFRPRSLRTGLALAAGAGVVLLLMGLLRRPETRVSGRGRA